MQEHLVEVLEFTVKGASIDEFIGVELKGLKGQFLAGFVAVEVEIDAVIIE